jgi:hypothetical protein
MQVIRLSALMFTAMALWAATAKAMPASDPDSLATKAKAHKVASATSNGSDWTYEVGVGVGAALVLVGGLLVTLVRRHTGTPVQA